MKVSYKDFKMDTTITSATIATVISIITSVSITLYLAKYNEKKNLDDQLDSILKIAIQYPYLESKDFTNSWTSEFDRNDEKFLRYDVYCNLLFNYLSRIAEFYKHDKKKIENHIAVKDWIRLHAKCWKDPTEAYENIDTYDKAFVDLIESYLNGK